MTCRYQQNLDVAYRCIEGEAVLVVPSTSEVKVLNPVGTHVWEQMEAPRTLEELVASVIEAFEVDAEAARPDVQHFLDDLVSRQLAAILA